MNAGEIRNVALVGAGNLAHALALALHQAGLHVAQVRARKPESAHALAASVGAEATDLLAPLPIDCDLLILAVKDDALPELVAQLAAQNLPDSIIIAHTSGSMPLSVLAPTQRPHGVLYPLQTFTRGRPVDWHSLPLLLEADTDTTHGALRRLALKLSPQVETMDSERRKRVHLGAVFASNFVNFLVHAAGQVGGDYRRYLPLLAEVVAKLQELTPIQAQTGPAKRGDRYVIEQHRALLASEFPELLKLYDAVTEQITRTADNPPHTVAAEGKC